MDPFSSTPDRAYLLQNVYPLEMSGPSVFVGRPGFQQAGSQLASGGVGQLVYQFTKLAGTEYTVAIVGGKLYTFNWSTRAWTEAVNAAAFSAASITISTTAPCYAVTFDDKMVVSDGVNVPWAWDGTTNGGLTKMTNAPVFYGQPTVRSAKLVAIKNTERNTIVWSEENAVNTGYEAGGYNNAWTLGQTDQEGLYRLEGTNDALYYFRERSSGIILGDIADDFQNNSTQDGLSPVIGTKSPSGLVAASGKLYFLDADRRPQVAIPGSGVRENPPIWEDIAQTVNGLDRSELADAVALYHPTLRLVLFAVCEQNQTRPNAILVYNPILDVPVAVWRGFTLSAMGIVKDANGVPVLMHLSADGYAYDHGTEQGTIWDDGLNAGTAPIEHIVEGPHLGADARADKVFPRFDVLFQSATDMAVSVSYTTPRAVSSAIAATVTGGGARWDEFDWDSADWASDAVEQKLPVGLRNAQGRWIRPKVSHATLTQRFAIEQMAVEAIPRGDRPEVL